MPDTLAILLAKSGVALLDLIPREWETVVADYSRLDHRDVEWWNIPKQKRYDEIVVVDRNITTALSQRRIERELRAKGIEGEVRFAGNPETLLAYRHQFYLLTREGLAAKPAGLPPSDTYRLNRYMVVLVGLPASGKTILRNLFSAMPGFSCYKWGRFLVKAVEEDYGPMTPANSWELVRRFTDEVEARDKTAVARAFLEKSGVRENAAPFVVVDGVKSREQLIYTSYALRRPAIIVRMARDEAERQSEAKKRGDFDDSRDAERLEVLRRMGAIAVMDFADFAVHSTGCATDYDGASRTAQIRFTERFVSDMNEVLDWAFVSDSLNATKELVCRAATEVAQTRGYAASVEVV